MSSLARIADTLIHKIFGHGEADGDDLQKQRKEDRVQEEEVGRERVDSVKSELQEISEEDRPVEEKLARVQEVLYRLENGSEDRR